MDDDHGDLLSFAFSQQLRLIYSKFKKKCRTENKKVLEE